jgi:cytochrome c
MIYSLIKKWAVLSLSCGLLVILLADTTLADELSKGIGPVKELKLETISLELATAGKKIFDAKCAMCHKMGERYAGPELKDVTKRRAPEWIMNMILNPGEMLDKDPVAQELLAEFLTKMTFQNVTQDEARSVLEYFRYYDEKGEIQNVPSKEEKPIKKDETKKPVNKKKN